MTTKWEREKARFRQWFDAQDWKTDFRDVYRDVAWEAWWEALSDEALNVAVDGGQTILVPLGSYKN